MNPSGTQQIGYFELPAAYVSINTISLMISLRVGDKHAPERKKICISTIEIFPIFSSVYPVSDCL